MINPLRRIQLEKLNKDGNTDLCRKIDEIITRLNESEMDEREEEIYERGYVEGEFPKAITLDEVWDMLYSSYPEGMDCFENITKNQSHEMIRTFWKKLERKS